MNNTLNIKMIADLSWIRAPVGLQIKKRNGLGAPRHPSSSPDAGIPLARVSLKVHHSFRQEIGEGE